MGDRTAIEWCDATWNPLQGMTPYRWYCEKISDGCTFCYASRLNKRFTGHEYPAVGEGSLLRPQRLDQRMLEQPLRWRRGRMIFVCSMTDLFGEWVTYDQQREVFDLMLAYGARHHLYLVLTKRPNVMAAFLQEYGWRERRHRDHIWLGTTVEHERFWWRADVLKAIPAAIHWISAEPLLGSLHSRLNLRGIEWIITGGESGGTPDRALVELCRGSGSVCSQAHWTGTVHPAIAGTPCSVCGCPGYVPKVWAKSAVLQIRDHATALGVPFFHKQWGGPRPTSGGKLVDGQVLQAWPAAVADWATLQAATPGTPSLLSGG